MYTMRDVSDADLTSRVQHLTPWVQDLVDQTRERQSQLDMLRQQRDAAAGQAAQAAASKDQPAASSQAPDTTPPASQDGWCTRHQVAMERRNNAKGTWWSHWLADEERWCRGK